MRQVHLHFFPGGRLLHEVTLRNMYAEEEDTIYKLKYQTWWICAIPVTRENQNSPTKAYCDHKGIR